jgi:hypothetical protein
MSQQPSARSSAGQSSFLLSSWPPVRIRPGALHTQLHKALSSSQVQDAVLSSRRRGVAARQGHVVTSPHGTNSAGHGPFKPGVGVRVPLGALRRVFGQPARAHNPGITGSNPVSATRARASRSRRLVMRLWQFAQRTSHSATSAMRRFSEYFPWRRTDTPAVFLPRT